MILAWWHAHMLSYRSLFSHVHTCIQTLQLFEDAVSRGAGLPGGGGQPLFVHGIAAARWQVHKYDLDTLICLHDLRYLDFPSFMRFHCREKLMPQIVSKAAGSVGTAAGSAVTGKAGISRGQSVLFTNDPKVLQVHRETVSNLIKCSQSSFSCAWYFFVDQQHSTFTSVATLIYVIFYRVLVSIRCPTAVRASRICCALTSDKWWCAQRTCTTRSRPIPHWKACAPTWRRGMIGIGFAH